MLLEKNDLGLDPLYRAVSYIIWYVMCHGICNVQAKRLLALRSNVVIITIIIIINLCVIQLSDFKWFGWSWLSSFVVHFAVVSALEPGQGGDLDSPTTVHGCLCGTDCCSHSDVGRYAVPKTVPQCEGNLISPSALYFSPLAYDPLYGTCSEPILTAGNAQSAVEAGAPF